MSEQYSTPKVTIDLEEYRELKRIYDASKANMDYAKTILAVLGNFYIKDTGKPMPFYKALARLKDYGMQVELTTYCFEDGSSADTGFHPNHFKISKV